MSIPIDKSFSREDAQLLCDAIFCRDQALRMRVVELDQSDDERQQLFKVNVQKIRDANWRLWELIVGLSDQQVSRIAGIIAGGSLDC